MRYLKPFESLLRTKLQQQTEQMLKKKQIIFLLPNYSRAPMATLQITFCKIWIRFLVGRREKNAILLVILSITFKINRFMFAKNVQYIYYHDVISWLLLRCHSQYTERSHRLTVSIQELIGRWYTSESVNSLKEKYLLSTCFDLSRE